MPEVEYAIEVESRTNISNADYGISNGFFRFITGRPAFVALGDHVAFSVDINGLETIQYAFNTGQLYQASNPPFKIANTVPTIGMIFTVLDNDDFTGGELATAKGSAPANGDMFRVDQNGEGDEDAQMIDIATAGINSELDMLLIASAGYFNDVGTDPAVSYVGVNVWYNNFIVKKGLGSPSRSAGQGIEKTGDYGTLSGFQFSIKNTNKIWKFLETNQIYVVNKEVRLFAVIDEVFYQIWEGVVKDLPRTDTRFSFDCIDAFKKYHKIFPPSSITEIEFPDVISDFIGETIPVAVGDVVYNRVLNIASQIVTNDNVPVWAYFPDGDYTGTAWKTILSGIPAGGTDGMPTILVLGNFTGLDAALTYIKVIQGNELQTDVLYKVLKIGVTLFNQQFITVFVLDTPLEGLTEQSYDYFRNNNAVEFTGKALLGETWVRIFNINYRHIVSNEEIKEFVNVNGLPVLLNWVEDNNAYTDVSRLIIDTKTDSGGDPAYPHIKTLGRTVNDDSSLLVLSRIQPTSIKWQDVIVESIFGGPPQSTPIQDDYKDFVDDMIDLRRDTFCNFTRIRSFESTRSTQFQMQVQMDIDVPEELRNDSIQKMYLAFDWSYVLNNSVLHDRPDNYHIKIVGVDNTGREFEVTAENNAGFEFPNADSGNVIHLPDSYYEGGYPGALESDWGKVLDDVNNDPQNMVEILELSSDAKQPIINGVAVKLRLRLMFDIIGSGSGGRVEFLTLKIHEFGFLIATRVDLLGTKLYTRLKGEFSNDTDNFETNNVYRAFQLLLQKYDGLPDERIDWFNVPDKRGTWHVGRQIEDQKTTFEYLKELCKQSFVCLVPTREGKRRLSAWIEHPFPVDTHDESEVVDGSIKNFFLTPISSLYNSFEINYGWNPGRRDYDKQFFIRKVDQDFADLPGSWQTFVGGIDDYPTANELWKACRFAYTIAEIVQPAPEELSKLMWYINFDLFSQTRAFSGANNSAFKFLREFIFWTIYQKGNITYEIPINAVNVTRELLDFITFNDIIYTDNEDWGGWIRKVKYLTQKDTIQLTLIFQPRTTYEEGLIIERGDQGDDTITERGDQGDDLIIEGEEEPPTPPSWLNNCVFALAPNAWGQGNAPSDFNTGTMPAFPNGKYSPWTLTNMGPGYGFVNNGGDSYLNFEGNDDLVITTNDVIELNSVQSFSIELWFWENFLSSTDYLFFKFIDGTHIIQFRLTNFDLVEIYVSDGSTAIGWFNYIGTISANAWTHIVAVYDGTGALNSDRIKIYVDSVNIPLGFTGTIPPATPNLSGVSSAFSNSSALALNGRIAWGALYNDADQSRPAANYARGRSMGLVGNNFGDQMVLTPQ